MQARARRSAEREGGPGAPTRIEGLRPSNSPTRSLARCFATLAPVAWLVRCFVRRSISSDVPPSRVIACEAVTKPPGSDWTRRRVGDTLALMTIILILAVALASGVIVQSRWALVLPLAFGACVAVALAVTGHGLSDTPIPFLVVVSTLVMVGGQGLRSRGRAPVL